MTPPNIVQGQLSLGSFIKLFVIAAIGLLPVLAAIYGVAFLIGLSRGGSSTEATDFLLALWPMFLLGVVIKAVSIVFSGFLMGLFSYPFYAWLCHRWGGVILKGRFEVML